MCCRQPFQGFGRLVLEPKYLNSPNQAGFSRLKIVSYRLFPSLKASASRPTDSSREDCLAVLILSQSAFSLYTKSRSPLDSPEQGRMRRIPLNKGGCAGRLFSLSKSLKSKATYRLLLKKINQPPRPYCKNQKIIQMQYTSGKLLSVKNLVWELCVPRTQSGDGIALSLACDASQVLFPPMLFGANFLFTFSDPNYFG
jgi:hypothetical protein